MATRRILKRSKFKCYFKFESLNANGKPRIKVEVEMILEGLQLATTKMFFKLEGSRSGDKRENERMNENWNRENKWIEIGKGNYRWMCFSFWMNELCCYSNGRVLNFSSVAHSFGVDFWRLDGIHTFLFIKILSYHGMNSWIFFAGAITITTRNYKILLNLRNQVSCQNLKYNKKKLQLPI